MAFDWLNNNSRRILESGYLLTGETPEGRIQDIAEEAERRLGIEGFANKFYDYMSRGFYSLSSPVWSNYGRVQRGFPVSCFNSHCGDSIPDIMYTTGEVGVMSKFGGGTSVDLSPLRHRGAEITNNGKTSGSVHFARMFEQVTDIVSQGCYDDKTEILTEDGWKTFKEVVDNQNSLKVAQVNEDDTVTFVTPTEYFQYDVDETVYSFKDGKHIDLLVTKNHNMVYEDSFGEYQVKLAEDMQMDEGTFKIASNAVNGEGMTPHESLQTIMACNGTHDDYHDEEHSIFVGRSTVINNLKLAGIPFDVDGDYVIVSNKDLGFVEKMEHIKPISEVTIEWAEDFINQLMLLDDTSSNVLTYTDKIESNLDFIQSMATLCDTNSVIIGENITLDIGTRVNTEAVTKGEQHYTGVVYCVTVPSHKLIVRRNGLVVVCGNSSRRGRVAPYMNLEHDDAEEFLEIARDGNMIQDVTTGVTASDEFMESVRSGESPRDKRNRKVWAKTLKVRSEIGFPYVIWTGNMNRSKPQVYKDKNYEIRASNLCSEIALPSSLHESFVCVLSSMNLARFDEWEGTDAVETMIYFLDTLVSESIEKLETMRDSGDHEQELAFFFMKRAYAFLKNHRALGLGTLGYHTMLQDKMLPFASDEARKLNIDIHKLISERAYKASQELAELYGEPDVLKGYGLRNTTQMAIAPTKTSSNILGGVSQGIEPIFSNYFIADLAKIKVEMKSEALVKTLQKYERDIPDVWNYINKADGSVQSLDFLTDYEKEVFKTMREIDPYDVVDHAADRQKYIDQAQSLNLMIDPNMPVKDINKLMYYAWDRGVKSVYYQYNLNASKMFAKNDCVSCHA